MTRVRIALVLAAAVWTTSTTLAGGWAVITLEQLPEVFQTGQRFPLTFTVRQHGVHPVEGLSPRVEASAGAMRVSAGATAGAQKGQYVVELTLPHTGDWVITIHGGFPNTKLTLLPIKAVGPGVPSAAAAGNRAELGRRLFVAKGCVTCHGNNVSSDNASLNIGPVLIPQKYRDEFLARVLENPSAALPPSRLPVGSMPNLNLQPKEINALVTFINDGMAPATTARRQR